MGKTGKLYSPELSKPSSYMVTGLDLTPVDGHTRVSDVNVDEGRAQDAGRDTKLPARIQARRRPPRPHASGEIRKSTSGGSKTSYSSRSCPPNFLSILRTVS
jgi:hypothetical protein